MISGDVVHCFGRGREFGFPTANLFLPDEKAVIMEGVYATMVEVDGYIYNSVTNIGSKPTFNDYSLTIESFWWITREICTINISPCIFTAKSAILKNSIRNGKFAIRSEKTWKSRK